MFWYIARTSLKQPESEVDAALLDALSQTATAFPPGWTCDNRGFAKDNRTQQEEHCSGSFLAFLKFQGRCRRKLAEFRATNKVEGGFPPSPGQPLNIPRMAEAAKMSGQKRDLAYLKASTPLQATWRMLTSASTTKAQSKQMTACRFQSTI